MLKFYNQSSKSLKPKCPQIGEGYKKWLYQKHDATAVEVVIPRGVHQHSNQHLCVDWSYHWYVHTLKLTVNKTLNFWNTKAFLPQE